MADLIITAGTDIGQSWNVISVDDGKFIASNRGDATLRNLPAGSYAISWSAESGYETPVPAVQTLTVAAGETKSYTTPTYTPVGSDVGTLTINAGPLSNQVTWTVAPDPGGGNATGSGSASFSAPAPETYTVTWGEIPGYDLPDPDSGNLLVGGSLTLGPPAYIEQLGSLSISMNEQTATWTITGPSYSSGSVFTGNQALQTLIPGQYRIEFDDIFLGLTAPADILQTVTAGGDDSLAVTFQPRATFSITVNTTADGVGTGLPADFGGWVISCTSTGFTDVGSFRAGGDWDTNNATPSANWTPTPFDEPSQTGLTGDFYTGRSYQIVWDTEANYQQPGSIPITFAQTINGDYVSQAPGSLTVTKTASTPGAPDVYGDPTGTSIDDSEWTLYGPNGFSYTGTDNTKTWNDLPPGVYYVDLYNAWRQEYHMPPGYDFYSNHPENPAGTGNGVWTGTPDTLTEGGSVTFDLQFQYRAPRTKANGIMGANVAPQMYWGSSFSSNALIARSFGSSVGRMPVLDASGYPTEVVPGAGEHEMQSGSLVTDLGQTGPQEFRVFWRGNGSFTIRDATNGQGELLVADNVTDAGGDEGLAFTYNMQQRQPIGVDNIYLAIRATDPAPNNLREFEVVWRGNFDSTNSWGGTGTPPHDHRDTRLTYIAEPMKTEMSDYMRKLRFMSYGHHYNISAKDQGEADWPQGLAKDKSHSWEKYNDAPATPQNPGAAKRISCHYGTPGDPTTIDRIDCNVDYFGAGRYWTEAEFKNEEFFLGRHVYLGEIFSRGVYPINAVNENMCFEVTGFTHNDRWVSFDVTSVNQTAGFASWWENVAVGTPINMSVISCYRNWQGEEQENQGHGRLYDTGYGGSRRGNMGGTMKQIVQSMIDMCNATDCDMFIVFPMHWAESLYMVRKFVEHIESDYKPIRTSRSAGAEAAEFSGLKPGLKVYIEYSNEIWNATVGGETMVYASNWTHYYANRPVDPYGRVFPMGQRGSVRLGFEDITGIPLIQDLFGGDRGDAARRQQIYATWKFAVKIEETLTTLGLLGGTYAQVSDRYRVTTADQIISDPGKMFYNGGSLRTFDGITPVRDYVYAHETAPYVRFDGDIVDPDGNFNNLPWANEYRVQNFTEAFRLFYMSRDGRAPTATRSWDGIAAGHPFRPFEAGDSNTYTALETTVPEIRALGLIWGTYEGGAGKSLPEASRLPTTPEYTYDAHTEFHRRSNEHWYQYECQMNNYMQQFEAGLTEPFIDFIYRFDNNEPWGFPDGQFRPGHEFMKWRAFVDYQYWDGAPTPEPPGDTGTINIDMTGAPSGTSFSISPGGMTGNVDTSTTYSFPNRPADTYTLTWLDTVYTHEPPTPATEQDTIATDGQTISFGPPTYVARGTGSIQLDITQDTDGTFGPWTVTSANFPADFPQQTGTGDRVSLPGTYLLGREYRISFGYVVDYFQPQDVLRVVNGAELVTVSYDDAPTGANRTLDADGWNVLAPTVGSALPADDTVAIYVSTSGDNGNDGLSPATAVATIEYGLSLLRAGQPDHLYLKRGDIWVDPPILNLPNGKSRTEPIVIQSYGTSTDPMPMIHLTSNVGGNNGLLRPTGTGFRNLCIRDVGFYAIFRDKTHPYTSSPTEGNKTVRWDYATHYNGPYGTIDGTSEANLFIGADTGQEGFLIEGCYFRAISNVYDFATDTPVDPTAYYSTQTDYHIRRCVFDSCWGYQHTVLNHKWGNSGVFEENLLFHHGWCGADPGADRTADAKPTDYAFWMTDLKGFTAARNMVLFTNSSGLWRLQSQGWVDGGNFASRALPMDPLPGSDNCLFQDNIYAAVTGLIYEAGDGNTVSTGRYDNHTFDGDLVIAPGYMDVDNAFGPGDLTVWGPTDNLNCTIRNGLFVWGLRDDPQTAGAGMAYIPNVRAGADQNVTMTIEDNTIYGVRASISELWAIDRNDYPWIGTTTFKRNLTVQTDAGDPQPLVSGLSNVTGTKDFDANEWYSPKTNQDDWFAEGQAAWVLQSGDANGVYHATEPAFTDNTVSLEAWHESIASLSQGQGDITDLGYFLVDRWQRQGASGGWTAASNWQPSALLTYFRNGFTRV